MRRLLLLLVLVSAPSLADEALPAWTSVARSFEAAPVRAFVATGRSGEAGPAEFKSDEAEEQAVQRLAELVARWQEATLACARKDSLARTKAKSGGRGLLVDFELTEEIDVSLYRVRVRDRAYEGKRIVVQMTHELDALVSGLAGDESRPASLREAARTCGQAAFDELVAGR